MTYDAYKTILPYADDIFLNNLRNIINNKPLQNDSTTTKFLKLINLFGHEYLIQHIAILILKANDDNKVNIYTGMNIPVTGGVNYIKHHLPALPNSYYIIYKGYKYNYSVPFMVKKIMTTVKEQWTQPLNGIHHG